MMMLMLRVVVYLIHIILPTPSLLFCLASNSADILLHSLFVPLNREVVRISFAMRATHCG